MMLSVAKVLQMSNVFKWCFSGVNMLMM